MLKKRHEQTSRRRRPGRGRRTLRASRLEAPGLGCRHLQGALSFQSGRGPTAASALGGARCAWLSPLRLCLGGVKGDGWGRVGSRGGTHIDTGVKFFRGQWCAVRKYGGHRDFATCLASKIGDGCASLKSKVERGEVGGRERRKGRKGRKLTGPSVTSERWPEAENGRPAGNRPCRARRGQKQCRWTAAQQRGRA